MLTITEVVLPVEIEEIRAGAFSGCRKLKSISIPEGITSIEEHAFSDTGIDSFTIPYSVSSIANYAFANCTQLSEIYNIRKGGNGT